MKALHLKILLSYCFSTFFPFHKLQLRSYNRHILIHLRHWDQINKKAPSYALSEKKSRHKISSVKIRHFLPTNFFGWLSENIN